MSDAISFWFAKMIVELLPLVIFLGAVLLYMAYLFVRYWLEDIFARRKQKERL